MTREQGLRDLVKKFRSPGEGSDWSLGIRKTCADELEAILNDESEWLVLYAERYRYIRDSGSEFVHYTGGGTHGLYEEEKLDALVDAAIKAAPTLPNDGGEK